MMKSTLPWFSGRFPLYLAPMAGVSDKIFRQLCKEYGADVLTTEFVSAEGIFRRNERTRDYLDFDEIERPIGVQLFGANAEHMAEAARQVIDWVRPDFVDLNFGCPVNKVVAKNGGSALLKDCPALAGVAVRPRERQLGAVGLDNDVVGGALAVAGHCRRQSERPPLFSSSATDSISTPRSAGAASWTPSRCARPCSRRTAGSA